MITDPYLFLHLSTFLPLRDVVYLTQTTRQYACDPLITDEIKKRLHTHTSVDFISFPNNIHMKLAHTTENCFVFELSTPIPLYIMQDDVATIHEQIHIYFRTPGWDYKWSGNVICQSYLKHTDFVYQATKSEFGSVDLVLYRDDEYLFIREIRLTYMRNIKQIIQKQYWKQIAYNVVVFALALHIVLCDKLLWRISTVVFAFMIAMYITDDYDTVRMCPQPNNI